MTATNVKISRRPRPSAQRTATKAVAQVKVPAKTTTLETMVNRIRTDVQAYAEHASAIQRDTTRLAPLVAQAFELFQKEQENATRLAFCKLFATPDQLVAWPETDAQAKAPDSHVQGLFNSIEYLIRRAGQLRTLKEKEEQRQTLLAETTEQATAEAQQIGLTGEDLEAHVEQQKQLALQSLGPQRTRPEDVAEIILDAWYSDLDEFAVFSRFVQALLGLKYSENTTAQILEMARERIMEQEQQLTQPTERPTERTVATSAVATRPPVPFHRRATDRVAKAS